MNFELATVLSITTGVVLAPFDEIQRLAEHLAGEPVWTHQMPRVSTEAAPRIVERYPLLADVVVPYGLGSWEACEAWIATLTPILGASLDIDPLPRVDHTSIDPLSELAMHYPHVEVVPVVANSEAAE